MIAKNIKRGKGWIHPKICQNIFWPVATLKILITQFRQKMAHMAVLFPLSSLQFVFHSLLQKTFFSIIVSVRKSSLNRFSELLGYACNLKKNGTLQNCKWMKINKTNYYIIMCGHTPVNCQIIFKQCMTHV